MPYTDPPALADVVAEAISNAYTIFLKRLTRAAYKEGHKEGYRQGVRKGREAIKPPKGPDASFWPHGSVFRYRQGCTCRPCAAAHRASEKGKARTRQKRGEDAQT